MNSKQTTEINDLFESLKHSEIITELIHKIRAGARRLTLTGLAGSSRCYLISAIAQILDRPVFYITDSIKRSVEAQEEISFFSGENPPLLKKKELGINEAIFSSVSREMSARLGWLYLARVNNVLIAEAPSVLERVIPKDVFDDSVISIKTGDNVLKDEFISRLVEIGYVQTDFVQHEGELSTRGSIIDVFSPATSNPIRLELLGDEISSIRYFRTYDQRFIEKTDSAIILPASEVILSKEAISRSVSYIRRKAGDYEIPASTKVSLINDVEGGKRLPHVNTLMPSFYPGLGTVFDYLLPETLIILDSADDISRSLESYFDSLYRINRHPDNNKGIVPDIDELYLTNDRLKDEFSRFQIIQFEEIWLNEEGREGVHLSAEPIKIKKEGDLDSPFEALANKILEAEKIGTSVHIVVSNDVNREMITEALQRRSVDNFKTHIGHLSSGFTFPAAKKMIIGERDIFEDRKKIRPRKIKDIPSAFLTSFSELKPADFIVHVDFGIGIYNGLKRLRFGNMEGDFLQCEYQGGDKVYVPVDKLKLVQRYIGERKNPRIDKLGQQNWKRVVRRVKKAVENIARELVELYALRKAENGFQFSKRDKLFKQFEFEFPYEETIDQNSAIEDVMSDMESQAPMDRLICGDVGFGKTEVALRAAVKAVMDGKQVAFLVPTTLLAYQHYLTSVARLKQYPVMIEMLSRFKSQREEKVILKRLKEGNIDILIGTHKLLGNKIQFRDLGLLIIDEEHKFGVSQKEKLRKIKKGIDVLSLSATPIPRTLQLSLAGIRDISLINTPPEGRQAIETYVLRFSRNLIRKAILNETDRGGSIFFIHNRIEDICNIAEELKRIVPEARIEVTHGRMHEKTLENSIDKFSHGEIDVLVTTAIVESGLDIQRANTMIINSSHRFGLADLYQLRGRVGRTDKKAFAYFLIPGDGSLTPESRRRLKAITELNELGSGYRLALSDLEIRGAGNIFGTEQSGHIADVGLELYLELLDESIRKLKREETIREYEPEIKFNFPAFIPDDYIEDPTERLLFYKKLSTVSSEDELYSLKDELRDRFGKIPEPGLNLLNIVELKILMKELQIGRLEIKDGDTIIDFRDTSPLYKRFKPTGRMRIIRYNGDA
ncbi:MAG: transcription-repair coupling factor, partial [Deltaproteobacteria bacterium]|nr:transcription-repair coupling factor [Deltaproteobacteria bacterium]